MVLDSFQDVEPPSTISYLLSNRIFRDSPIKCIKKRRRSNVVEKFREVSITVCVDLKGMI